MKCYITWNVANKVLVTRYLNVEENTKHLLQLRIDKPQIKGISKNAFFSLKPTLYALYFLLMLFNVLFLVISIVIQFFINLTYLGHIMFIWKYVVPVPRFTSRHFPKKL